MSFWGIEVKPGTPYVHQYDDENGRLHISQATIVPGSSNKRSVVQCAVGDKKPIYLCSLLPDKLETCLLNLDFEEEDEVTFSVIGPHPVHLSGFFYGDDEEQADPCCDDDDSYGEDVIVTDSEDEDGSSYDSEDEHVDAEFGLYPSKAPNSGVRIEEIVDDEKPANEDDNLKQSKKRNKNENSNSQIVVKSRTDIPILETDDEDKDGFPKPIRANKSDTVKSGSRTGEKDDESVCVKKEEKKEKDATSLRKLKRKLGAVFQNEEPTSDNNVPRESSVQPDSPNPQSEIKQKKNKKKKVEKKEENVKNTNGIGLTQTSEMKKEMKKKSKQEERVATPSTEEKNSKKGSVVEKKEKINAKAMQVRTYPNGLMIEELAMGKPDGKKASKGKKIGVRYIGKLKKNNKIFDSNIGGKPFNFRLGIGEVIAGWDVGVEGMRIGDRRRLTIPPAMGYGNEGSPPVIPGNAWLVFDVELVEVR